MAYDIVITEDAERQLRGFPARQCRFVEDAILARLVHEPTKISQAIKRLRPNPFPEYELRVSDIRVLYNVEDDKVVLLLIGRKVGNKLVVEGQEFHGHKDDPPQPPGSGSSPDAE